MLLRIPTLPEDYLLDEDEQYSLDDEFVAYWWHEKGDLPIGKVWDKGIGRAKWVLKGRYKWAHRALIWAQIGDIFKEYSRCVAEIKTERRES